MDEEDDLCNILEDIERECREIPAAIERETRTSRYRDRGERVHPIQHDINRLINFVLARRKNQQGALGLARRCYRSVDTEALCLLVDMVLEQGSYDAATRRCCERVLAYCTLLDAAFALRATLTGPPVN